VWVRRRSRRVWPALDIGAVDVHAADAAAGLAVESGRMVECPPYPPPDS